MILDEANRRILRTLQQQPSLTIQQLSDIVGLSQTPCWRRLKQLETEGVIAGRALVLDPRQLGYAVGVFANVKVGRHDEETIEAFETAVLAHPAIVECFSMGGEYDFIMRIVAQSIESYEHFLKKVLLHLPGVTSVNSSFTLKQIKLTTDLPV